MLPNNQNSQGVYNTFWRRFAAIIIDSIILWPLTFIDSYIEGSSSKFLFCIGVFISSLIYTAYFIILHSRYGQTIGKKITGIKVVDIDEANLIGIKRSIYRELPWIIANIVIIVYAVIKLFLTSIDLAIIKESYNELSFIIALCWMIIELITMLTNYKKRALHDYLAKSVVVKTVS